MNLQQIGKYWYLQYNLYLFFLMTKINTTYLPMMLFFWEKSLTVKLKSACFLYYCRSWLRIPQILRETEKNLQKSIPFTTNKNRHRKDNRSYPTLGGAGNDKNNTYWNTKQSAMAKKYIYIYILILFILFLTTSKFDFNFKRGGKTHCLWCNNVISKSRKDLKQLGSNLKGYHVVSFEIYPILTQRFFRRICLK